jgi:Cu+-exporting ATPase
MDVDTRRAKFRYDLADTAYYFCSAGCLDKFKAEPQRYLNPDKAASSPAAPEGTIWTCPMHPQIRRDAPGSCPFCWMSLEPLEPTSVLGPNS